MASDVWMPGNAVLTTTVPARAMTCPEPSYSTTTGSAHAPRPPARRLVSLTTLLPPGSPAAADPGRASLCPNFPASGAYRGG
ncbi:hypothetical protein K505DRAFT_325080 [Melanomma pulvis-pyrius CBS 109.77]|uniref:Uncharacterized protein n=1 Tax=Melanomma pulvis-pyrius CBS 109.77 TaxID=1314802 RepID=A0A6A6XC19_9PLEO|nr:hypothetical protein K505DRAFT_325080 [Melanomma pulvis-pyrius CBS 109.77]